MEGELTRRPLESEKTSETLKWLNERKELGGRCGAAKEETPVPPEGEERWNSREGEIFTLPARAAGAVARPTLHLLKAAVEGTDAAGGGNSDNCGFADLHVR
jgi:hypothetical protein